MKHLLLLFTFLMSIHGFAQTNVYQETFETAANGSNYNTSITEFIVSGKDDDYFTRTDGSNIAADINNIEGSFFFGAQDINGGDGVNLPETLTTAQIDVTGLSNLDLAVLLAEDADGSNLDWDSTDYVHFNYILDGGTSQNLLWIESTESNGTFNSEAAIDSNFDDVGDGTVLTDVLTEFSAGLDVSGASKLEIQVEFDLNAGDEDIAIDNLRVVENYMSSRAFSKANVQIYPNPVTNGQILIDHQLGSNVDLKIFSIQGKQVLKRVVTQNESVDVSDLKSGVYLVNLTTDNYKATQKLIIR